PGAAAGARAAPAAGGGRVPRGGPGPSGPAARRGAPPPLLEVLAGSPLLLAWQAEDRLREVAADSAPAATLTANAEDREKAVAAWRQWFRDQSDRIDLTKLPLTGVGRGGTVICELDGTGRDNTGRVWECGVDGKKRWQIDGLKGPIDVDLLPGGRLLIAEQDTGRITERDRLGAVLWEKKLDDRPMSCRRLANGNTFVGTFRWALEL